MNHSGPASKRNGFPHDHSTLHCDGWVGTSRIRQKKKDQSTISTCSVASCGAVQYAPAWSDHWGEIYGIFFYPQPAVAFSGNKATKGVSLPTVTPRGTRTPFLMDCIWRPAAWVGRFEHTHTHNMHPLITSVVDPRPPCMSQKLRALCDHFLILLVLD